ncbi:hypothetical protein [Phenylobacterium sp.]|uniref:hypothetical protein n=1 Tax=Phenylobacterium sp. TaxID=1871053 RepID=UPI0027359BD0|nr:hypothetical protein [Phenylobacterium sp.]MDP3854501.1 hypothetical protein [Phenylobacterium sp.]
MMYPVGTWKAGAPHSNWPPGLAEAVGAVLLGYVRLEESMFLFFMEYLKTPARATNYLFSALHNRDRIDLLRSLVEAHAKTDTEREAVLFALKCYDICTENRNFLAHAHFKKVTPEGLLFLKLASDKSGTLKPYVGSLESIRDLADSMSHTFEYVGLIWGSVRYTAGFGAAPGAPDWPLPERPPQPRKLNWSPPLANPEGA